MIHTRLTDMFGLRFPIVSASMTPAATGALARAVSQSGALGMVGVGEAWDTEDLVRECAVARGDSSGRFGIGFFGWALQRKQHLIDAAIEERPALISISFIDPSPYAERIHRAGILLSAQVQSRRDAQVAIDGGVDLLIAQGTEAGGHTGDVSTLTMMQIVLEMTTLPVIVAGGVATGRGLAAVIAAGADGAWIGTPFLLAEEANVTNAARERIASSEETETVLTSLFDRIQNYPWPERFRGRTLQNDLTRQWSGKEDEAAQDQSVAASYLTAKSRENYDIANIYAGQSVGLRSTVCPARQIVEEIGYGAEQVLRTRFRTLFPADAADTD